MNGPGFDFEVLWNIGRAVLAGINPYSVYHSMYPPAASLLFSIFALLPLSVAYVAMCATNAILLVGMQKRKALGWLLFVPVLFMFAAGQIDLFFLALIPALAKKGWSAPVAAAAMTLKPQLAFVVLPWFLVRWLLKDRKMLGRFIGMALAIHAFPILIRPTIYTEFMSTVSYGAGHKFGGLGIWHLYGKLPTLALIALALMIAVAGMLDDEKFGRICMMLVNPVFAYYDAVLLIDTAPWWLLGPVSLIALLVSHMIGQTHTPFIAIPIAALLYRIVGLCNSYLTNYSQSGIVVIAKGESR